MAARVAWRRPDRRLAARPAGLAAAGQAPAVSRRCGCDGPSGDLESGEGGLDFLLGMPRPRQAGTLRLSVVSCQHLCTSLPAGSMGQLFPAVIGSTAASRSCGPSRGLLTVAGSPCPLGFAGPRRRGAHRLAPCGERRLGLDVRRCPAASRCAEAAKARSESSSASMVA